MRQQSACPQSALFIQHRMQEGAAVDHPFHEYVCFSLAHKSGCDQAGLFVICFVDDLISFFNTLLCCQRTDLLFLPHKNKLRHLLLGGHRHHLQDHIIVRTADCDRFLRKFCGLSMNIFIIAIDHGLLLRRALCPAFPF